MTVTRVDPGNRTSWGTLQRESEAAAPESESFVMVDTPATPLVNMTKTGQFILKMGYSPLGYNESCEILYPANGVWTGATTPIRQGEDGYFAWSVRVPTGWVKPKSWGLVLQFYAIVNNSGGPSLAVNLDAFGSVNNCIKVRGGGAKSVVDGLTVVNFPFTLVADTWHNFIFYVQWSGYSNVYNAAKNAPPAGAVVGKLKVWKCDGTPSAGNDFSLIVDAVDIPTMQRPITESCFPGSSWAVGGSCGAQVIKFGGYRGSWCNYGPPPPSNFIGVLQNRSADLASRCEFTANEQQKIVVTGATGGTFTLTFSTQTTAGIAWDANAATVQAALVALSNIAPGDVVVSNRVEGSPPITVLYVDFAGAYAETNVAQITASAASLTGPAPSVVTSTSHVYGTQVDSVIYQGGLALCDTLNEARAEFGLGAEPGGGSDADVLADLTALGGSDVRYGNTSLFTTRGGMGADRWRGSKITVLEEVDIHTMWFGVEVTGTGSQSLRLVAYEDDGGGGAASTRRIVSTDKTLTGPLTAGWLKRVISPPIRLTAGDFWVGAHTGTTASVVSSCSDGTAGALVFNTDTFVGGAADPAAALTVGNGNLAVALEGTPTGGGGSPGSGDIVSPVLQAAEVSAGVLTLSYDEPLNTSSTPAVGAYTVKVNAVTKAVSSVVVAGSTVTLALTQVVQQADAVTVSYTAGGAPVEDVAGNNAAALTDEPVANTTQGSPTQRYGPRIINPSGRIRGGGGRRTGEGGGG